MTEVKERGIRENFDKVRKVGMVRKLIWEQFKLVLEVQWFRLSVNRRKSWVVVVNYRLVYERKDCVKNMDQRSYGERTKQRTEWPTKNLRKRPRKLERLEIFHLTKSGVRYEWGIHWSRSEDQDLWWIYEYYRSRFRRVKLRSEYIGWRIKHRGELPISVVFEWYRFWFKD